MGLALVVGPAHAGKIALLLERFLEAVEDDPWLIVPTRPDVERVERDLIGRRRALLSGRIGTFDDVFRAVAEGSADRRPEATAAQRDLALRQAVAETSLGGLRRSAGSAGFVEELRSTLSELESGLVEPGEAGGELGALHVAYRAKLDQLGLWDREVLRRRAVERLEEDLDAWGRSPLFAYGFEDLTVAEWSLLRALAGRTDVVVSLPYEPGRATFTSLARTVEDLAGLADEQIEELPASEYGRPPALIRLERLLFIDDLPDGGAATAGAVRFLEGAGIAGTLSLVADELLDLLRTGTAAEDVAVVCESVERWRGPLGTTFGAAGIPFAVEAPLRLDRTAFGHSLLSLLRFAWLGGSRGDLFAFLRSPFSGLPRASVDYLEGRLRGRGVREPARVVEELDKLRGAPLEQLETLRSGRSPLAALVEVSASMIPNAYGLGQPPATDAARTDLRAAATLRGLLDELEAWEDSAGPLRPDQLVGAVEHASVPSPPAGERGRVAVLDLSRVRTRGFDTVFLLGLEEGSLPRRGRSSPFLDDDRRQALGRRLERPDPVSRDRYLFYTACTRAKRRLFLVREAASDEGVPREPSPFWHEAARLFDPDDVRRATRRRRLSSLTWPLEEAPSERERLRALARIAASDAGEARGLAAANGWGRRLERAERAFARPTRLRNPAVLSWLSARTSFAVTELERFADCSSAWLVERVVSPRTIDAEPDALLRGSVAHTALSRFYSGLPREVGVDRVTPEQLEPALGFMERCLDDALRSGVRIDLTPLQLAELRQTLRRDLASFVEDEARSPVAFVPRRLEAAFGSERAAPELQRGLALDERTVLTGKIDRIDVDPFSARGIVQDYKSGQGAHSAQRIESELRLQIPLYMLVLRDLVGLEPLGGLYRPLAGKRTARGMVRADAADDLPGFSPRDYLEEDAFWRQVETARSRAADFAGRIRAGDVEHDPRGGECPAWCDLWRVCRVARS